MPKPHAVEPTTFFTTILPGLPPAVVLFGGFLWLKFSFPKYLDSYMTEKGKNKARAEDVEKLATEARALTDVTGGIRLLNAEDKEESEYEKSQIRASNADCPHPER